MVRRSQFGPSDLPVLVLSSTCSSFYNGNLSSCSMRFTPPDYCHNYNEVGVICEGMLTAKVKEKKKEESVCVSKSMGGDREGRSLNETERGKVEIEKMILIPNSSLY